MIRVHVVLVKSTNNVVESREKMEKKYQVGDTIQFQSGALFTVAGSVLYEEKNMLYLVSTDQYALPMIGIVEEENGQDRIDVLDAKAPENQESLKQLIELFQAEAKAMIGRSVDDVKEV